MWRDMQNKRHATRVDRAVYQGHEHQEAVDKAPMRVLPRMSTFKRGADSRKPGSEGTCLNTWNLLACQHSQHALADTAAKVQGTLALKPSRR